MIYIWLKKLCLKKKNAFFMLKLRESGMNHVKTCIHKFSSESSLLSIAGCKIFLKFIFFVVYIRF